jgi:GNAT superfamily N-acetyltransferase
VIEAKPLERAGVSMAAGVLARALAEDPGWIYVFPGGGSRVAKMTRMLGIMIERAYVGAGGSLQVPGEAAAIWMPPGAHDVPLTTMLRVAPRLAWILGRRTPAAARMFRIMDARTPKEPHWYLAILGVDPLHQGKGLGVAVCAPVLARCDDTRTLAWLESTNPKNHSFYRRLGFELADEHAMPGGPTFSFFARRPR